MALSGVGFEIEGTDRIANLRAGTLSWKSRLEERATVGFELVDPNAPPYFRPEAGELVEVILNSSTVFAGTLESVSEVEKVQGEGLFLKCKAVDYAHELDRFYVFRKYEGLTAGAIVEDMIANFVPAAEGFTTTGVQAGLSMEKVVFGYKRVSDCIRELAKVTGFSWYVDENKDVKFFERTTFAAPLSLFVGSDNYRNLTVGRSRSTYRNRQFIRAGKGTTVLQTEDFAGDGSRKSFNVVYSVAGSPTPPPVVQLSTGGGGFVTQVVGIRGLDDDDGTFDWFFRAEDRAISQASGAGAIAEADVLRVKYRGLFPILIVRNNNDEIAARQDVEGGSGIYENVTDDKSIESEDFAEQKAEGLLDRFGDGIPSKIKFQTDDPGVRAGQLLPVNLPNRGDDLTVAQFLIDEVTIKDKRGVKISYNVSALSGQHLGGWAEFFRKLQEAGRDFTLREGETLDLLNSAVEGIEYTEVFSDSTALENEDNDDFTGWKWGTATWGKSFWRAPVP